MNRKSTKEPYSLVKITSGGGSDVPRVSWRVSTLATDAAEFASKPSHFHQWGIEEVENPFGTLPKSVFEADPFKGIEGSRRRSNYAGTVPVNTRWLLPLIRIRILYLGVYKAAPVDGLDPITDIVRTTPLFFLPTTQLHSRMRFPIVSACIGALIAASSVMTSPTSPTTSSSGHYACKCNPNDNNQAHQQAAIADVANIFLVQKNIQKLFDEYIPGYVSTSVVRGLRTNPSNRQYINHNPLAQSGRQAAIDILVPFFQTPGFAIEPHQVFGGQGYGTLHYKLSFSGINLAIMDLFRFQGTCIVEHWDVSQTITGNETNPIAFF